ncbi:MAG: beta-ketoacyl-[acyl-carrier-protein] synthase family protein [Candidatus Omnitrophica bacterium]|nr:beta-ketoacyl-[acyl-carrier-protein] synthase family protein [Candidatus Omnitrophota bacterium]
MMNRRVVVTGLGIVSSIGIGIEDFWKNLILGKSGISKVDLFDTSKFTRKNGGEVKNFNPEDFVPKQMLKFMGRASVFSIAATKLALKDAKIPIPSIRKTEPAFVIGVTIPEGNTIDLSSHMILENDPDSLTNKFLLNIFSPSIARNTGYFFKTKGANLLIPNACSAGNYSLSYGFDLIKTGQVDLAIAGGAEALSRIAYQGFQKLYAMAPDICAPFDKNRKGMLLGEGAGILILEPLEKAIERKAPIYAEILGAGLSCDAHHMTIPARRGIRKAMEKAINDSGLKPDDIDYINAHGTGTTQNDKEESTAIKEVFGERKLPVSSSKSMLGHCMGAASAIEAAACCMAIKEGVLPPTINFTEPDPECDIDCVPNTARKLKINTALNNAFAFGGNNCCIVFGKTG